jgi:hypothetical protein
MPFAEAESPHSYGRSHPHVLLAMQKVAGGFESHQPLARSPLYWSGFLATLPATPETAKLPLLAQCRPSDTPILSPIALPAAAVARAVSGMR